MRIETYSDSLALLRGLSALKQRGLTAKGILFLALSAQGRIYLAIPDNLDQMNQLEQLGQSPAPDTTPPHPSARRPRWQTPPPCLARLSVACLCRPPRWRTCNGSATPA